MGNLAAIGGVALLFVGILLVALLNDRRSQSWAPYLGIALAVLGIGVELVGAVAIAT